MSAGRQCSGVLARALAVALLAGAAGAQEPEVELQPLAAAVARLADALELAGEPLDAAERAALDAAYAAEDQRAGVAAIRRALAPRCLAVLELGAGAGLAVRAGPAPPRLQQQSWRAFLVEVHNAPGLRAPLRVTSPQAGPVGVPATEAPDPEPGITPEDVRERFLDVETYDDSPLLPQLSGLALEYRIVLLHSRDEGAREATLEFEVGSQGRDTLRCAFECAAAVEIALEVLDHDGTPTTASFLVTDARGRVYPSPTRRQPPDFPFQHQVYRSHGESLLLAPGEYQVTWTRGPEYASGTRAIVVRPGERRSEAFRLERWIHLAELGWWSGDHHIHAAGCRHYESPTQGVQPEVMLRHILGEDLNVGCVLSWGPCWTYQKRFFEGRVSALSRERHVMRFDVEVSGFPSSHAGHLSLIGLSEDDYPGTDSIGEWPSWDLPVLQWARSQGAVTGFSHSGWGLEVPGDELPNYAVPLYNSIGANEYIVDVAHDAVDFIAVVDTPPLWELNVWYHTLNAGFRTSIAGETDFPCIYGIRVGMGRTYVRMDKQPGARLDFDDWAEGLRRGRSYVCDGASHILDFRVGGVEPGAQGPNDVLGELPHTSGPLEVRARVAALLPPEPHALIRSQPRDEKPYWHLERARIGDTRRVPVELVVNGRPVARQEVVADGAQHELRFEVPIERSSWVALRIHPSSHTNPVFVLVDGEPVRASRRSLQWCLDSVDACWAQKAPAIRESEREAARAAYDEARAVYRARLAECEVD